MAVEEGIAWYVHGASRFVLSVALVWFWLHVSKPSHDEPDEWWFEWYVAPMENVLLAFAIQCVLRFANECWQGRGAIARSRVVGCPHENVVLRCRSVSRFNCFRWT